MVGRLLKNKRTNKDTRQNKTIAQQLTDIQSVEFSFPFRYVFCLWWCGRIVWRRNNKWLYSLRRWILSSSIFQFVILLGLWVLALHLNKSAFVFGTCTTPTTAPTVVVAHSCCDTNKLTSFHLASSVLVGIASHVICLADGCMCAGGPTPWRRLSFSFFFVFH